MAFRALKAVGVGAADPPGIATYVYLPEQQFTYVRVRKCAGSSLWNACLKAGGVQVDHVKGYSLGMWRNPIRRMESTYRFWHGRRAHGASSMTFQDWVMWALETQFPNDEHIVPQSDSGNMTNIKIPWDFDAFAQLIGVKSLPKMNDSEPMDLHWTDGMLARFSDRYAMDLAVWASIS